MCICMYVCMYYIFIFFELGRIAYMRTDGYFQPCATIVRAIDEAKAALESKGYTLVPFEHPDGKIMNLLTLIFSLYCVIVLCNYVYSFNIYIYIYIYTHIYILGTNAKTSFEVYCSLMAADGNWHSFMKGLQGERLHETYRKLWLYTNLPNFMRPTLAGK